MRRLLSSGLCSVLALLATPAAFACENPDDVTISLRNTPPEVVEVGEMVLELDSSSMSVIKRPPMVVEVQGHELVFDRAFASYSVLRVLAGQYSEPAARVSMISSSCHHLGGGTSGLSYLVARAVIEEDDGFTYLQPHPITGAELRLQQARDQKAAN